MSLSDLLIAVVVGALLGIAYVAEYLRTGAVGSNRLAKARVRVDRYPVFPAEERNRNFPSH